MLWPSQDECLARHNALWHDYPGASGRYVLERDAPPTPPRARFLPCDVEVPSCNYLLTPYKAEVGYAAPAHRGGHAVRCDKCDEAHETHLCPYFKGDRDRHPDAWGNYSGGASAPSRDARPSRICAAPRALPRRAYAVRRMPGDGACLFHSIAAGLYALGLHGEDGHSVRQRVARFIAENPDLEITGTPLRYWVDWDSGMTVERYAERLSRGAFWGGAIEMAACAQIYFVDVVVYEEDSYGVTRISDFLVDAKVQQQPGTIMVLYSGRSHYDALHDLSADARQRGRYGYGDAGVVPHGALNRQSSEDDEWSSLCPLM